MVRFILVFSFPNLSDDIYRFYWDGLLTINGFNPYSYLPSNIIGDEQFSFLSNELFGDLNSPEYFTIYPPVSQAIFAIATKLSFGSIGLFSIVLKMLFLVAECCSIFLILKILKLLNLSKSSVAWYALNPLIILEIQGNLHFEGIMITFLLWFLFLIIKKRQNLSALAISLSIGVKLLPLMFLPYLIIFLGFLKAIRYYLICGIILLLIFIPIGLGLEWGNFTESLDLYFRKFEFNASIYYLVRQIGYSFRGYNEIAFIGPSLAATSVLLMACLFGYAWKRLNTNNLIHYLLITFTIYLFFTTTVHPWYLSMIICLCGFTRFRYPVVWSGLIFLSYFNYNHGDYFENLWLVLLEYTLVSAYLCYELFSLKISRHTS